MDYTFTWETWIYIGIILFIVEIFTLGFIVICFGLGAFASSIFAFFDASLSVQLIVFSTISSMSFLSIRPYLLKYLYSSSKKTKTNSDSLIGRTGMVKEDINNEQNTGRVTVDGDNWRAYSQEDSIIKKGSKVEVVKINSIILTVKQKQ